MTIPQRSNWTHDRPLAPRVEEQLHTVLQEALHQHEARLDEQVEADDIAALVQRRSERARAEILEALSRMEDGSYGWCQRCDRPIPTDRLEIVPHTRHCSVCARES